MQAQACKVRQSLLCASRSITTFVMSAEVRHASLAAVWFTHEHICQSLSDLVCLCGSMALHESLLRSWQVSKAAQASCLLACPMVCQQRSDAHCHLHQHEPVISATTAKPVRCSTCLRHLKRAHLRLTPGFDLDCNASSRCWVYCGQPLHQLRFCGKGTADNRLPVLPSMTCTQLPCVRP